MANATTHTHWKLLTNPDYLGAYAFEAGEEKVGTIDYVREESVTGADGKKDDCTVAHFKERDLKPLILNATNCKAITKLYGTPFIEEWAGKAIVMRVQKVKAFGDVVDAVRIKPEIPKTTSIEHVCEECGNPLRPAYGMGVTKLAEYTKQKYGRKLCADCAAKEKDKQNTAEQNDAAETETEE